MIELGARACAMVFVIEPKRRKNMLIDRVIVKATSKKKKKGPGSRRKFAMKYRIELAISEFVTLYGISTIIEESASALGWYRAYRLC